MGITNRNTGIGSWHDLPELAASEGYPLHRHHRSWSSNTCPNCGEGAARSNKFSIYAGRDGRWRYKCFACGIYGDSGDFLAMTRHIPLSQALTILDGGFRRNYLPAPHEAEVAPAAPEVNPRLVEVIDILREHALDPGPRAYLHRRGLTDATQDMAIASGQLRMLPAHPEGARRWLLKHVGEQRLTEAGLLKAGSKWPALAFRPLLAIEPGGQGFECRATPAEHEEYQGPKAIRYGHFRWPWYFSRESEPDAIMVTEGIIDALTVWQILPEAGAVLGVPGVSGWSERWFRAIYRRHPTTIILIGFDTDQAGSDGDSRLSRCLSEIGLLSMVVRPPRGEDWNESLTLLTAA